jgi:hypothetical protein
VELNFHSPVRFMTWCLVKHRDSFTFAFLYIGKRFSFQMLSFSVMKYEHKTGTLPTLIELYQILETGSLFLLEIYYEHKPRHYFLTVTHYSEDKFLVSLF